MGKRGKEKRSPKKKITAGHKKKEKPVPRILKQILGPAGGKKKKLAGYVESGKEILEN